MFSGKLEELLHVQHRTNRLIWFSMMVAPIVYAIAAYLIHRGEDDAGFGAGSMVVAFPIAAAAIAIGARIYHGSQFSDSRLKKLLSEPITIEDVFYRMSQKHRDERLLDDLDELGPNELRIYGVVLSRQAHYIVGFAMMEAIAIMGLLAANTTGDARFAVPFAAAAILMLIPNAPDTLALAKRVQQLCSTVPEPA